MRLAARVRKDGQILHQRFFIEQVAGRGKLNEISSVHQHRLVVNLPRVLVQRTQPDPISSTVYARLVPLAGRQHHRADHRRNAGGVADGLRRPTSR